MKLIRHPNVIRMYEVRRPNYMTSEVSAFAACYHYILSYKLLFFLSFITTSLSSRWFTRKVTMVQRQIYGHAVLFSLFYWQAIHYSRLFSIINEVPSMNSVISMIYLMSWSCLENSPYWLLWIKITLAFFVSPNAFFVNANY